MADPRTDFFASGAGDADAGAQVDARTAFFALGAEPSAEKKPPTLSPAHLSAAGALDAAYVGARRAVGGTLSGIGRTFERGAQPDENGRGELIGAPVRAVGRGLQAAGDWLSSAQPTAAGRESAHAIENAVSPVTQPIGRVLSAADQAQRNALGNEKAEAAETLEGMLVPGAAAGVAGRVVKGFRNAADAERLAVRTAKVGETSVPTAEEAVTRQAQASPQSQGAAAAAPRVSNASPQLQQAIVNAAQRTGGAVNPDALARHVEADTLPVPIRLTEGEALGDVTRISNERNNPGLADFYNKRNGLLKQNIQAIRDDVGPDVFSRNSVEHGDTLIKAYQDKAAIADADIDAKYQALRDANGGQFPVDVKKLTSNVEDQLHQQLLYEHAPVQLSQLKALADKGNMSFEQFEAMRTNLARTMRSSTDGNERAAAGIIRQQMEELPLAGETAKLKPLADAARSAARAQFQALDADPAYKAAVQEKVAPDDFVRRFVTGGTRDNVSLMRENLKDNQVAQQTLGVAALDYLRDAAKVNPDGTGTFAQSSFNKALRGLDPKIRSLLSADQAETLEQLGNVARYTQEQPAGHFINNSKTFVAAAAEGAKGLAEHAVNSKTLGIGGTAARNFMNKRAARAEIKRITSPGAGLDILEEKP